MGKVLAGAINNGELVLHDHSDPGVKVTNVHTDPVSKLVTVTFQPAAKQSPVVLVSSCTPDAAFVSGNTNTTFIIGGAKVFHFMAVMPNSA